MNAKAFLAMLHRDAHVARRNFVALLLQTLFQPMLLVFVFGRIMTTSGLITPQYKSMLLPGIIALAMVLSGVWSVAMPLVSEFQFTKEIEDRLLAPIPIEGVAIEKVVAGMLQALAAGAVVIPTAWLVMGRGVQLSFGTPLELLALALLVACLAASVGLVLGTSVGQTQIGLMFSLMIAPMIFFGCAYYPWSSLARFPVLQKIVLINPMVYASEGFLSTLVPRFPHLPKTVIFAALAAFDVLFLSFGLRQFRRKAVG
ncbi:MAG TPA: ABC transporter permease [Thermoanaerobaculia bacterium]|nr:ABC transporter permease [Thermoanaerobaculia bacterium]